MSIYSQLGEGDEAKLATVLAFDNEYKSATVKAHKNLLIVGMSEYEGLHQLGKPRLYSLALSLEKIEMGLSKLAGDSKSIQTNISHSDDRIQEREEHDEWSNEQRVVLTAETQVLTPYFQTASEFFCGWTIKSPQISPYHANKELLEASIEGQLDKPSVYSCFELNRSLRDFFVSIPSQLV